MRLTTLFQMLVMDMGRYVDIFIFFVLYFEIFNCVLQTFRGRLNWEKDRTIEGVNKQERELKINNLKMDVQRENQKIERQRAEKPMEVEIRRINLKKQKGRKNWDSNLAKRELEMQKSKISSPGLLLQFMM